MKRTAQAPAAGKSNGGSLTQSERLQHLYTNMLKSRAFEERARAFAKRKRLRAEYPAGLGHEAVEAGCTLDLEQRDVLAAGQRDWIADLVHGLPLHPFFSHLCKNAAATNGSAASARTSGARSRQAGSLLPGAALSDGLALAKSMSESGHVVVALSGIGSSFDDVWHEMFAAAGSERLPILFVARNGLSATAGKSGRTGKRPGHAFPSIPVDGHDAVAVYRVAHEAIRRARRGGGPTLMECKPYLLERGSNGRSAQAAARHSSLPPADPLMRMEQYLSGKGLFDHAWKRRVMEKFSSELDAAVEAAERELEQNGGSGGAR
ncbi:MAG TPA: thiamine pyrophosphate-dependent enzyme [Acidobacteriaceae bacterium]|nr:thiamine pyrophosphate-dependent enzyme [Acidobacteriaceae bacterium]